VKILVAGAFEASSQWAHAINTVKMAQGFARLGHAVTLVCRRPTAGAVPEDSLNANYGLKEPMRWVQLPRRVLGHSLGENWSFAAQALRSLASLRPDLVYARNYTLPWLSSRLGIVTAAESHAHPGNKSKPFRRLVRASGHSAFRLWVTISRHLADHYATLGVSPEKLAVLPDAVDLQRFRRPAQRPPSPYPPGAPAVVYVGHLYDYKGIPTILAAAEHLPQLAFHLVGGWPDDIARQQRRVRERGLGNVTVHGAVPHAEVPRYLWHADVLLLPPSAHHPSAVWTSPMKLGEYLASGSPVVASAIPALRDLVTDAEVRFVAPDDGASLAEGVSRVLESPGDASRLTRAGTRRADELSYVKRAQQVLERVARGSKESSHGALRSALDSDSRTLPGT